MAKNNRIEKDGSNILRRTAKEVKLYRRLMKILPAAAGAATMLTVLTYMVALMYNQYGSFTVTVNKFDNVQYALSLSESRDFNAPTMHLNSKASEEITNISTVDLPQDLDRIDGEHNGENYVAYTFYAKNAGSETVDVDYQIYIKNMTLDIERAVRVRLYTGDKFVAGEEPQNRTYVDYARTATDGSGPEPGTTEFYSTKIICRDTLEGFAPEEMVKFTVVIWLEGDDPDCINDIIGGQLKIDMSMRILGIDDKGNPITETDPPTGEVEFIPESDGPYDQ